jgi:hypothetical protein
VAKVAPHLTSRLTGHFNFGQTGHLRLGLSNPYKNPADYDRVRDSQRRCIRELLRCMGTAITMYSANGGLDDAE